MTNPQKLFCLLAMLIVSITTICCSDDKDTSGNTTNVSSESQTKALEKQDEQPPTQATNTNVVSDPTPKSQEIPGGLLIPSGKECEKYFAKDAIQQANAKGVYVNSRRSVFIGDDGIVLTSLMYKDKKLQIVTNLFYVGREVCIQEFSSSFVSFENNEIHMLSGLQKHNCAKVKSKDETGAIGMYHLPVNSTLFTKLLISKPFSIALGTKLGDVSVFKIYDEDNAKNFRNAIRCAFEVLAVGFDLSNENILVDTVVNPKK